jgi:hypothetical protein
VPSILRSLFKALLAAAIALWGLVRFHGNDFGRTMQDGAGVAVPASVFVGVLGYELVSKRRSKRS